MEKAPLIDFSSRKTHLLLNPRMPEDERRRLEKLAAAAPALEGHVWIATSGTSGALRLTALSKDAIMASAAAANRHIDATTSDVWCCVLPVFHVGGLGIYARAELTGSRIVASDWSPEGFCRTVEAERVTISSLVPAQLRDLVTARLVAPGPIRAIVVGGGGVPDDLYTGARDLGWPILPSFGMTEACSQIATARPGGPELYLLSHVQARVEEGERLAFSGPSLLTGYARFDDSGKAVFVDPKVGGWFLTEDRGSVAGETLRVFGRAGEFVKIGGESVDLKRLGEILDSVRGGVDAALIAAEDERLGHVIHLVVAGDSLAVTEEFNRRVLPFERIREVHVVESIPRSPLGKLLRTRLTKELTP